MASSALANIGASAASSAASALASSAVNSIFGGGGGGGSGASVIRNISAPGFQSGLSRGRLTFARTPVSQNLLDLFSQRTGQATGELAALGEQIRPGFGRLTESTQDVFSSARQRLADRAMRASSNLRENLSRRRILGSSFASDALTRQEAEFGRLEQELTAQEQQALAGSFLAELDLATQNIAQRTELDLQAILTNLNQLNLEGEMAANLATGTQQVMSENAQLQARLAAANTSGAARFFTPFINTVGTEVGGLFE